MITPTEKIAIESLILELESLVIDFSATKEDTSYLIIIARLESLINRVDRFVIPDEPEEENISWSEFKDNAKASCLEIEANLDLKTIPVRQNISVTDSQPTVNKSVPIYKWGIQFDGKSSVKAFIERISELSIARNVTEQQLYACAVDLFCGPGLAWFRSIKDKGWSWQELVKELELAFLPSDYDERLLDEIKARKQGRSEPVSLFVATMQNLFNRLTTPLHEIQRLKMIRKNILPKYIDALVLQEIKSTSELICLCKKIDEASQIKNEYIATKTMNFLEADLAYVDMAGPSVPKNKNVNFNNKTYKTNNTTRLKQKNATASSTNGKVTCWNCRNTGHVYSACKQFRTKFCYGCGKQNFTSRTCPTCKSGNPKN